MKKRGVTIIEMVIYMSILSVLLLFFTEMFATLINKQLETESLSNMQQDSNYLLSRLNYDFTQASSIVLPAVPGVSAPSLRLMIGATLYDYYLTSGNLVIDHGGIQNQLNSSETSISNLSFRRLGVGNSRDVIQVKFDVTSKIKQPNGYDINHFSTTLGIREK